MLLMVNLTVLKYIYMLTVFFILGCNEVVTWVVFTKPLSVSQVQVSLVVLLFLWCLLMPFILFLLRYVIPSLATKVS